MDNVDSKCSKKSRIGNSAIRWLGASEQQFMQSASGIRVIWLSRFYHTDTEFRELIIDSNELWKSFVRNCLLPWYKNGLGWSDPSGMNYSVEEYAHEHPQELGSLPDEPLVTVFHPVVNVRLIVDGCHRSVAIQSAVNKNQLIPKIRIIECYGTQVHAIFPCDFCNIMAKALSK